MGIAFRWTTRLVLVLALAACADEAMGPGAEDGGLDAGSDLVEETGIGRDTSALTGPGGDCQTSAGCVSDICISFEGDEEAGFCSEYCLEDADCPFSEWICVLVELDNGELAQVCLPESFCVDLDGDSFGVGPGCLGPDCDDDDELANPDADEVCDGVDNDCDDGVDENPVDVGGGCFTGQSGRCSEGMAFCRDGQRFCEPLATPEPEVCDGEDNDCDGLFDSDSEGNLLRAPCYGGAVGTLDVGPCRAGYRECKSGIFGECVDEVRPVLEVCDGLDNDCDGHPDNGNPGGGRPCETGLPGVCARGLTACSEGGEIVCVPVAAEDEVCDGIDNDCDELVDEDEAGEPLTRECYEGPEGTLDIGECHGGEQTCAEGEWGTCEDDQQPLPEICDLLDNDCDEDVDENIVEGGGLPCSTGEPGVCGPGLSLCDESGSTCVPLFEATGEICDGLDNDCDEGTDEDDDGNPLTRPCYDGPTGTLGVGVCAAGTATCAGGELGACQGQVLPSIEVCDGRDNDCDDDPDGPDEGNPDAGVPCDTGLDGICAAGVTDCSGDTLACVQINQPKDEVCDGRDNDCDDQNDEDEAGDPLSQPCYSGPEETLGVGACQAGTTTCQQLGPGDAAFGPCVGEVPPTAELCDGLDNDCDDDPEGPDEGNPEGGFLCSTGLSGACSVGITTCVAGDPPSLECVADVFPSAELCDGIDNDCDGTVDVDDTGDGFGGFPELGELCTSGLGNCARVGVFVCDTETSTTCSATPGTAAPQDVCDNTDDDCDGDIDEDYRNDNDVYDQLENCGACGVDCNNLWPGGPASFNVTPLCAATPTAAFCDFDCLPGFEDADRVEDNGCEFEPDLDAVYVSTSSSGGLDTDPCTPGVDCCGSWDAPCETVTFGLWVADNSGAERVRVSSGVFFENVQLVNGIDLWGGHNPRSWIRDPAVNETVIQGTTPTPDSPDRMAVRAIGIDQATELSGFTIAGEDAAAGEEDVEDGAGGNSIALWIEDCDENLLVTNNLILAASGGNGLPGDNGDPGTDGEPGDSGNPSVLDNNDPCDPTFEIGGGGGGFLECDNPDGTTTEVSGGAGGDSTCGPLGTRNGDGEPAESAVCTDCPCVDDPTVSEEACAERAECVACEVDRDFPGCPGRGGGYMTGSGGGGPFGGSSCSVCDPTGATPGNRGLKGGDGGGGDGAASAVGDVPASQWRGQPGGVAEYGTHGLGGGGGGAGAGVNKPQQGPGQAQTYYGTSGGGGGSGGCAGDPGEGGGAGGGSFGIFLSFSSPPNVNAMPDLSGNHISRGLGGAGGRGGVGGAGGDPGAGGLGGVNSLGNDFGFCLGDGGAGGAGGRGGHGGGGGGGAGGISHDVYVWNANNEPGYATDNTFEVDDTVDTAGPGGVGGTSSNPDVGEGTDGVGGGFGIVEVAP